MQSRQGVFYRGGGTQPPHNWDADSRADIDAGAIEAMHETLGNRPTGCGCGG